MSISDTLKISFNEISFNENIRIDTVHRVIIFTLSHKQTISPSLNSSRHDCVMSKYRVIKETFAVLHSPTNNADKRGKNIRGRYFLYTVHSFPYIQICPEHWISNYYSNFLWYLIFIIMWSGLTVGLFGCLLIVVEFTAQLTVKSSHWNYVTLT